MRMILAAFALLITGAPAFAAESWGLPNEEPATFDGKVVDVQCVLTGNCPRDCGAGRRQMGLLTGDGKLVLAMKNADPFAGATRDLVPYCGKTVTADGLFATNDGVRVFALQRLKPKGGDWITANGFARHWAKANGSGTEEWYRRDPAVAAVIAADGKLGLGPGAVPGR